MEKKVIEIQEKSNVKDNEEKSTSAPIEKVEIDKQRI